MGRESETSLSNCVCLSGTALFKMKELRVVLLDLFDCKSVMLSEFCRSASNAGNLAVCSLIDKHQQFADPDP